MNRARNRLPGIYLAEPSQGADDPLPRMDVAAFVGFASRGPLHLPVKVESLATYRDVFGDKPPNLCWDPENGTHHPALLGAAVEDFFRQGGRTAWIVRVADERKAQRARFELPGIRAWQSGQFAPATAFARAFGPWAETLRVKPALLREGIHLLDRGITSDDSVLILTVATSTNAFLPHDLIELRFEHPDGRRWRWLQFLQHFEPATGGTGLQVDVAEKSGFFFAAQDSVSRASTTDIVRWRLETTMNSHARHWMAEQSPPQQKTVSVQLFRLRLRLWTQLEIEEPRIVFDLGLHPNHPRYFGSLPVDEVLFTTAQSSKSDDPQIRTLIDEISHPRFPLAGYNEYQLNSTLAASTGKSAPIYLPVQPLSESGSPYNIDIQWLDELDDRTSFASISSSDEVDGLSTFSDSLFLDPRIDQSAPTSLLSKAARLNPALRGLHSLALRDDVSIIAVPDAVHRGWSRALTDSKGFQLKTPDPIGVETVDEWGGPGQLVWTRVPDATNYRIEIATDPGFVQILKVVETELSTDDSPSETQYAAEMPDFQKSCQGLLYVRVRAQRFAMPGPWSTTHYLLTGSATLRDCGCEMLPILQLRVERSAEDYTLVWEHLNDYSAAADCRYELQEGNDVLFASSRFVSGLEPNRSSTLYYRVRCVSSGRIGPWSNTEMVGTNLQPQRVLNPIDNFSDTCLLNVQRAMLRFCAARQDVIALLALPRHFREAQLRLHVVALGQKQAAVGEEEIELPTFVDDRALSYAACFHPWLGALRESEVDFVPPDGAIAGQLSSSANTNGAWRAIANRTITNVSAVDPNMDRDAAYRLIDVPFNLIISTSSGFAALDERVLSNVDALDAVHVRRLLILLRRLCLREGQRYTFDNNGPALHERIQRSFERVLSTLYLRGAFAGSSESQAFFVTAGDRGAEAGGERGQLVVQLGVAPAAPMRFIQIQLTRTDDGLFGAQEVIHG